MRQPVQIDAGQRKQIEQLAGLGLTDESIASVMGFSEGTLKRKCREELTAGRHKGKAKLAQAAMQMACSGKHAAVTIFMCKCRLGWRETDHSIQQVEIPRPILVEMKQVEESGPNPVVGSKSNT